MNLLNFIFWQFTTCIWNDDPGTNLELCGDKAAHYGPFYSSSLFFSYTLSNQQNTDIKTKLGKHKMVVHIYYIFTST